MSFLVSFNCFFSSHSWAVSNVAALWPNWNLWLALQFTLPWWTLWFVAYHALWGQSSSRMALSPRPLIFLAYFPLLCWATPFLDPDDWWQRLQRLCQSVTFFLYYIRYVIFPRYKYNAYSCKQLGNSWKICITKLKLPVVLTTISNFYTSVCFT